VIDSLKINESVRNGEYYANSMNWYRSIFIFPLFQKAMLFVNIIMTICLVLTIAFNMIKIFPLSKQLRYNLEIDDESQMKANIIKINNIEGSVENSIAQILIKDYIINRESYDYNKLLTQYVYINNSSSPEEYQNFKDYMSLNNPSSPIIKYQKYSKRNVEISAINILDDVVEIYFTSKCINNEEIIENANWQVILKYSMDDIAINTNGKFHFSVNEYKPKLIKDLMK